MNSKEQVKLETDLLSERKKVCQHDFVIEIPCFNKLSLEDQSDAMYFCRCECKMTGWWTRIQLSSSNRQDYPAFRCQDCKRIALINSYNGSPAKYCLTEIED